MKTRIAAMMLAMCATALRADEPPVVEVRFVVEANQFVEKLAESGSQPAVEAAAAAVIASEAASDFTFVDWKVPAPGLAPAARLHLVLTEVPAMDDFDNFLEYRFSTGGPMQTFEFPIPERPVFPFTELAKPLRNPVRLTEIVVAKVKEHFANAAFKQALERSFLFNIPLTISVPQVRADEKRVLVPLPWERLSLDDEAKLKVSIRARPEENADPDQGFVILSSLDERTRDPGVGTIEASVESFQFPSVTPRDEVDRYIRTANLLRQGLLQEFGVHMHDYKRRTATTVGPLITRP